MRSWWDRTSSTFKALCLIGFALGVSSFPAHASNPRSAYYSSADDRMFWFVQISDVHIGARGTQDEDYLTWIVNEGRSVIEPEFIVATGDLTDSTDGNLFGYPNGPYQDEWDQYKSILANRVDASNFYDIPGNHDAYNDKYFQYYLANSIQGRATGQTQSSWTRSFPFGTYEFLGVNSADNSGAPFSLVSPWGDYAGLDSTELAFIGNQLALHQDAALTFVFGHHPVTSTGDSQDTYLYYGASEFISYLDQYGASLYGYGHTHRFEEDLFAGDDYTGHMNGAGVFYLNVPSLGKSDNLHYSIIAVDCNGVSSVTAEKGIWPVVLVTAPLGKFLGSAQNPYSYFVPNAAANPIRALVFDTNVITSVEFRIGGVGDWYPMTRGRPTANPHLWEGIWDASGLPAGDWTVEVRASSGSGTTIDLITVTVEATSSCGDGSCGPGEDSCTCPGDCGSPGAELCTDGRDNDCDGLVDCEDSDCSGGPDCVSGCGNGACDEGEDCVSCPADCISAGGTGVCGNGVCEPASGEDCLSCPSDCAGTQSGKPSGRFCCGDGDGVNPVDCEDARCIAGGFRCGTEPAPSCCGDSVCGGIENGYNCEIDCGAPAFCGNAVCDSGEDACSCPEDCGSPVAELCTDGVDNDCDGHVDCADADCLNDSSCSCGAKKSTCVANSDCCSNRCSNKGTCL